MKKEDPNKRRKFLSKGLQFGLVATAGGIALTKYLSEPAAAESEDTVELMTTDGTLVQVPKSELHDHSQAKDGYNVREGFPGKKFVMVIDLARCKNALKCQESCNKNHYITGDNAWLKVYKMQDSEAAAPYWMPTTCMHCDKPPCVTVCPVDATFKRKDGIVLIDNERCIGCRFCMAACPYSIRVFNWNEPEQPEEIKSMPPNPDYAGMPSIKGTVDKCDFCPHMIHQGELPHCVTACPNGVFFFGDKYEDTVTNGAETFRLSELLKNKAGYRLMESLGTEPSVYYLPPVNRVEPFEQGLEFYDEFNSVKKTKES
ncbi:MAG: 4Fe-4S dicluster domain-containing protein [Flavobacteriaceae bacterium]|nr:4Fe-4S dicluster domain-containing protein [Flavobacteriaceae bacterium]